MRNDEHLSAEWNAMCAGLLLQLSAMRDMLWAVQLEAWPDSRRVDLEEVLKTWEDSMRDVHQQRHVSRALNMCLQYPVGVFYECGKREDGSYRYRGFRFGVEGQDYVSSLGAI